MIALHDKTTRDKHLDAQIVGRFAPSPTGPLHFGTLIAAVGSYLLAKQFYGRWLLRIEDLDPPRVVSGAADAMLILLEQLGFTWDGEITYQSDRFERYREIVEQLHRSDLVFPCNCTRKEILASAPHPGEEGPVYPGTCRDGTKGNRIECAMRLRVTDKIIRFNDGILGLQQQSLNKDVGDFVLHRVDGLFAYQLAVVVDDIDAGVNQVVRGADLLMSTPRQIFLYESLDVDCPKYYHLPLAYGDNGKKLSKRNGDFGLISRENGANMLWRALAFLGQEPPLELFDLPPAEILLWGVENFKVDAVPTCNRPIDF